MKWWQRLSLQKRGPADDQSSRFSVCWSNIHRYFASLASCEKSVNRCSCAGTSHPVPPAVSSKIPVKCSVLFYTAVLAALPVVVK